ncbi:MULTISPECIES: cupin domain-containing protein [Okeania]|uniref:Cupin domain-containing protein n=1 Tax=Okeania hirsuta TaxID=1458930 RepID=A0A3N6PNX8_9CYAN|nr:MULTISPECIES: cupin domain-containing protein [Okeania]NET14687.1 cupin domain-containing protein [Okeania sp. SIO1H6]NES76727.1 cupin domain-containing protein [Okeania sp. SIO1H4]NES89524.1 cupin domain-containing protein [Okeania sp. SIO2B9]NET20653.1 cupin domain-containing protein [Okeania sp. SIO1H5]NET93877.1 cupin domain-containing protein [Okeania sp. SIO1H2]
MILSSDSIPLVRGYCGALRKLVLEGLAQLEYLVVDKAEKHYHKKTTEYYYVLEGTGHISLDDNIQPIKKGDVITIKPGVKHQAIEGHTPLEILVIQVPPVQGDCYIVNE